MNGFQSRLGRLAVLASLILSVPLVLGFLGRLHPAFDSFAHFRVHLAVLLVLAALGTLVSGLWKHGLIALVLALASAASALGIPGLWERPAIEFQPKPVAAKTYTLLHLNLRFDHPDPRRVLSLLEEMKPDFVLLNEASAQWTELFPGLLASYPYQQRCHSGRRIGGTAILSRLHFDPSRVTQCSSDGALAMATIDLDGEPLDLAAIHLHWPWPFEQSKQIAYLSPMLRGMGEDAILAGDLNATPWSVAAEQVGVAASMPIMQSVGPSWLFDWLPGALRPWVGLPIDQVYAKGRVVLHSGVALPDVGSDHLPLFVTFSMPRPTGTDDEMVEIVSLTQ
jgi:endonuclease/exonuclease/phosphatase (EEP) superfamily protein YafD